MHAYVGEQPRVITFVSPRVSSPCIGKRQSGSKAFAGIESRYRVPSACGLVTVPPELTSAFYSSRRISQHTAADKRNLAHALTRTALEGLSVVAIAGVGSIPGRFTHFISSVQTGCALPKHLSDPYSLYTAG